MVVGSGPNGLAAAVTCARAGLAVLVLEAQPTVGGGARTDDLGLAEGVVHDLCSAVHPLAVASPFLRAFDLGARGVEMLQPEVVYAHPLDGARAGIAYRSVSRTADALGVDGHAWSRLFGPLAASIDTLVDVVLGDLHRVRPVPPAQLRTASLLVARLLAEGGHLAGRRFESDVAPALFTGVAAHASTRLPSLAGAGTALLLGSLAHAGGWPILRGGSQAITDALVADLLAHGGTVETGVDVTGLDQLPRATAYLFDTTPRALVRIMGPRLPLRVARTLARFPYGNGVAKVDFVLSEPVPWAHAEVRRAGTVHVGGSRDQLMHAEADVAAGRLPDRPMVLASDPTVVDPTRVSARGDRPLWTYAHVPAGCPEDLTEAVTAQIERFAPGFREVVVASRCVPAVDLSRHDANYVRGDIGAGAITAYRMLARPRLAPDPYATGVRGVYLCSASTPPGPGVHGLGGWYAARRALWDRFGVSRMPDLSPGATPSADRAPGEPGG